MLDLILRGKTHVNMPEKESEICEFIWKYWEKLEFVQAWEKHLNNNWVGEKRFDILRDKMAVYRIRARLDRVVLDNFGTAKPVGDGVCELKIDHGPGYRVYYAMSGKLSCCC